MLFSRISVFNIHLLHCSLTHLFILGCYRRLYFQCKWWKYVVLQKASAQWMEKKGGLTHKEHWLAMTPWERMKWFGCFCFVLLGVMVALIYKHEVGSRDKITTQRKLWHGKLDFVHLPIVLSFRLIWQRLDLQTFLSATVNLIFPNLV